MRSKRAAMSLTLAVSSSKRRRERGRQRTRKRNEGEDSGIIKSRKSHSIHVLNTSPASSSSSLAVHYIGNIEKRSKILNVMTSQV